MVLLRPFQQTQQSLRSWVGITAQGVLCRVASRTYYANVPEPMPLPSLPDPPTTSPPKYISASEFDQYLLPLFSHHWRLMFSDRELIVQDGKLKEQKLHTPILMKRFYFPNAKAMGTLLDDLVKIAKAEKHDPSVALVGGKLSSLSLNLYTIPVDGAPSLEKSGSTRIGPGISLKDLRTAIQVENIFEKDFIPSGDGFDPAKPPYFDAENSSHAKYLQRQANQEASFLLRAARMKKEMQTMNVSEVLPIPAVPEASETPATDEEFQKVLIPLYTRGWSIAFVSDFRDVPGTSVKVVKVPRITGFFRFNSFDSATAFAKDVLAIAETEKMMTNVWIQANTVLVQNIVASGQTVELPMKELRFAVLTEKTFAEKYSDKSVDSDVHVYSRIAQPISLAEMKEHPFMKKIGSYVLASASRRARTRKTEGKRN